MCACNHCASQALCCKKCVMFCNVPLFCTPIHSCCCPGINPPAVEPPFVILCSCKCAAKNNCCR